MKPDFISERKPLLKPTQRWIAIAVLASALLVAGFAVQYIFRLRRTVSPVSASAASPQIAAVSALGHLRPEGEVIRLSAPIAPGGAGSRVAQVLVKEGETVKAGQVVAVLDNAESLKAALARAAGEVEVAQANLARVQAGAKSGELEAQRATIAHLQADASGQLTAQSQTIARLEAELKNARAEFQRYLELFQNGAVTASQWDSRQLALTQAQEQLNAAKTHYSRLEATFQAQIQAAQATLKQLSEVRPTDVQAAQAEVRRAMAGVTEAEADLNLAYIRSPIEGQVLKIHTRSGEVVGSEGIIAIGQTQEMNVIAEVYELDVSRIRIGQSATVSSSVFPEKLRGTVSQIGLQVNPQEVISTDPTANVDNRIVEVKIRLEDADRQQAASFTNLQVNVVIH